MHMSEQIEQDETIVSFIIPAFNEETSIRESIRSIRANAPHYLYQIIVVDNGSTDNSAEIALNEKATLIKQNRGTIASARNKGAQASEGEVLIFLDADVLLTNVWQEEIDKVIAELRQNAFLVTGSRCNVTDKKNWISRYWFARMRYEDVSYINSGHLLTSRKLFDSLRGFRGELNTSEDYDFCLRAKQIGARIVNNQALNVIHTRYPATLKDFIARERWHGSEDFKNIHNIFRSKVAWVVIVNVILISCAIIAAISSAKPSYILIYGMTMYFVSIMSTIFKFGFGSVHLLLITSVIFFFYYIGRTLSVMDRLRYLINRISD